MNLEITPYGHVILTHGIGAENYIEREEGTFQVRHGEGVDEFPTFVGAFIRYFKMSEDAAIWDVTEKPCLIERKTILSCLYE